jgi:hypothetical protein
MHISMTRPEDDVQNRTPLWDALHMFFMDTDPAIFLEGMAETCARSPYTVEEIEQILFNEVLPACRFNMFAGVAPEWSGFQPEWLKERVLKTHRFGRKRPWLLRRYTQKWWDRLKPAVLAKRSHQQSR